MTDAPPTPQPWRPWSRRTSPGADLALAIPLFLLETGWLGLDRVYGYGLEVRAAQGEQTGIDAAALAHIGRLRVLLIAVLVMALLGAFFRARRTVIVHLLVALLTGGSLMAAQHERDESRPPPPVCVRRSADC
ncbi:DUF6234 family protein [Streptomyces sp. NPDC052687]|uniref:DUF6234 family protein n=1 Tax=Streptomyces sp. NPDC052687 TaxID=3154759 RepID=UPI00342F0D39